jgi:hypothetical protein
VGFAAETDEVEAGGRAKLERKGADLLVVNDVSGDDAGFEVDANQVVILDRAGGRVEVPLRPTSAGRRAGARPGRRLAGGPPLRHVARGRRPATSHRADPGEPAGTAADARLVSPPV